MVRTDPGGGADRGEGDDRLTAKRVSFPLAGLNLSGGIKNTLAMANALAASGHDVTVIVPDFARISPFPIASAVRVRVLTTPAWVGRAGRRLAYYARLALSSARGYDVCLVPYSLTVLTAWLSSFLARGCRVVYIVSAYEPETHGTYAESSALGRRIRAILAAWSYRLPLERLYVSQYLATRCGEPGAPTIRLGIDHSVFHAHGRTTSGVPRVGVIARRGPVKGHAYFLEAWSLLPERPLALEVVRLDPVDVPSGAVVWGPRSEAAMGDFYRGIDIFVFSSLEEGFPAPPLEAMACGAAVVATRCGGVEEYAVDGLNAVLVPTRDAQALARAIYLLTEDATLRARVAAEGIRTAAAWTREQTDAAVARLVDGPLSGTR